MTTTFHERVIAALKQVPKGRVVTYGQVAAMAGNPRGARQVVRILNTSSEKEGLPWHRVINREGRISLKRARGYELQKALLMDEDIAFGADDTVDLKRFQWDPARQLTSRGK